MKTIRIMRDESAECPNSNSNWTLYSFNRRHRDSKDRDSFFTDGELDEEYKAKLAVGLAFLLDCSEHGNCNWEVRSREERDHDHADGILVFEGGADDIPADAREKSAKGFCETYTCWANGEVYGYIVEDSYGEHVDSCWGFYGNDLDYMFEEIGAHVAPGEPIRWSGDSADLAEYHKDKMNPRGEASPEVVALKMTREAWVLIKETLESAKHSRAMRKQIKAALATVRE